MERGLEALVWVEEVLLWCGDMNRAFPPFTVIKETSNTHIVKMADGNVFACI